jgi:flagellar L-ring protein precursor FlgH
MESWNIGMKVILTCPKLLNLLCGLLAMAAIENIAQGQDASLLLQPVRQQTNGTTLENSSFLYRELPPESRPRDLAMNDIVTVLVDYRTRFLSEGDAESRKTASLNATLKDWLQLSKGQLGPATQRDGDPKINGTLTNQFRAESDIETLDSLTFRIAAKIVDIRPNGNLVLEAHQTITVNEEVYRVSLSGIVRRESIQADNTVSSDSITELMIKKNEKGQVHDGYARGWLKQIYDKFHFF